MIFPIIHIHHHKIQCEPGHIRHEHGLRHASFYVMVPGFHCGRLDLVVGYMEKPLYTRPGGGTTPVYTCQNLKMCMRVGAKHA